MSSSQDFQLGSARDLFHFSSKAKSAKNEPKTGRKFLINFHEKLVHRKWKKYAAKFYNSSLKTPYLLINDHEIDYNHVIEVKSDNKNLGKKWVKKNMRFFDIQIVGIVSSVSARKLMCPSSAPS